MKSQGEGAGVAGAFRLQCRPDPCERREGRTPEYRELCLQGSPWTVSGGPMDGPCTRTAWESTAGHIALPAPHPPGSVSV